MFGLKKTASPGDPANLVKALEKLKKVLPPGSFNIDGVDIGKVVEDALVRFKGK